MLDVQSVLNRKRTYYKENNHIFPNWKKHFRFWRRIYLDLMKRDGFTESVESYYHKLLNKRRNQSDEIEFRKVLRRKEAELLGLNSPQRSVVVVNERSNVVIFPNGYRMSTELLRSHPGLIEKIKSYCVTEIRNY